MMFYKMLLMAAAVVADPVCVDKATFVHEWNGACLQVQ